MGIRTTFQHYHTSISTGLGRLLSVAAMGAAVYSASVSAASFAQVMAVEQEAIAAGINAQQAVEQLDDSTARLAADYRAALKQQDDLDKYIKQLRVIVAKQTTEAESLRSQLQRIGNLERDIVPLMSDMLDALEEFVALDMPFLMEERNRRITTLRNLLASSSISNAEKYRRVLEAYQIENDYGRTIEAWDGQLALPNSDGAQAVTFLKVGRLILFYQTLDGRNGFRWDKKTQQWLPLEAAENTQVARGIKMAREQIPSDLLLLPVAVPAV